MRLEPKLLQAREPHQCVVCVDTPFGIVQMAQPGWLRSTSESVEGCYGEAGVMIQCCDGHPEVITLCLSRVHPGSPRQNLADQQHLQETRNAAQAMINTGRLTLLKPSSPTPRGAEAVSVVLAQGWHVVVHVQKVDFVPRL